MPNPTQRVVVHAGPHKAASSSVQAFLVKYACAEAKKWFEEHDGNKPLAAFDNWDWPCFDSFPGTEKKHVEFIKQHKLMQGKDEELNARFEAKVRQALEAGKNVVVGSEVLDQITMKKEKEDRIISYLRRLFVPRIELENIRVAVNYRAPRVDQLISIYKQQVSVVARKTDMSMGNASFKKWMCTRNDRKLPSLPDLLKTQADPLGTAAVFRRHGFPVSVMDIRGGANEGLDVTHTVACEVLQVPCKDGKVLGAPEKVVRMNIKEVQEDKLDLSEEQKKEMDDILRRMECRHYHLEKDDGVTLHHPESLFTYPCGEEDLAYGPEEAYEDLRRITGCWGKKALIKESNTDPQFSVSEDKIVVQNSDTLSDKEKAPFEESTKNPQFSVSEEKIVGQNSDTLPTLPDISSHNSKDPIKESITDPQFSVSEKKIVSQDSDTLPTLPDISSDKEKAPIEESTTDHKFSVLQQKIVAQDSATLLLLGMCMVTMIFYKARKARKGK